MHNHLQEERCPDLSTLSGLSKVAGLPQMKLGWIVTGGPQADWPEETLKRLELMTDTVVLTGNSGAVRAPAVSRGKNRHPAADFR